jgi:hypothetical protein
MGNSSVDDFEAMELFAAMIGRPETEADPGSSSDHH